MQVERERKVRVLRIIARMNVGGPAIQICGLASGLNSETFEHLVLTGFCDSSEVDYLIESKVSIDVKYVRHLGRKLSPFSDLRAFLNVLSEIRRFHPDVVHTHTAKAGLLGRLAAIVSGQHIKMVHTFHGHLLYGYFNPLTTWFLVKVEQFLARHTAVLISVGYRVRDEILSSGIGTLDQFRIVNPGLRINELPSRPYAIQRLKLASEPRYISWIGRLVLIKRPDRLLEIAAWLKGNYPDVRLVVAGDGPMREEIEQEAKIAELPIEFVGWVLDIESILSVSEMMILTSDNEGTPLSLIQAQMAGLPVVSTDVGSVSEIVLNHETGFVVPTVVESIIQAIEKLLLDQKNSRIMGQKAKVRARELYSVERLVRDHENIYLELMKSL